MNLRHGLPWRLASIVAFSMTVWTGSAATAAGNDQDPPTSEWNDSGIDTNKWVPIPGSDNLYGQTPSSGAQTTLVFDPRFACTSGDSRIFPECADVMPSCVAGVGSPDGKPGTVVYWYAAPSAVLPVKWVFHSGPACLYAEQPRDILAEIADAIAEEFQRVPIAPATIGSQPGPHTLRGQETNVWAEATTQTFNLTMLDQQVTITATPVTYTWNYGDGTLWGPTPTHGAPLHEDRIGEQTQTSHIYTETGHLNINLTTHYNGSYSVNNGPQLPIPGQGNIPSPALGLTIWRAETHLYADNCFQNPQGTGC